MPAAPIARPARPPIPGTAPPFAGIVIAVLESPTLKFQLSRCEGSTAPID
jgi:hypothetical protein